MNSDQPTFPVHAGTYVEAEEVGRDLAIPAIGKAPWGTHFCQFYGTKQDLLDTLVPFFRAGLENNEMCLWMTSDPLGAEDAAEALSQGVGDLESRIAQGQLLIEPLSTWYLPSEDVDPERLLSLWRPAIEQALARGYAGLRVTGNESWLSARQWKPFMVYESTFGQEYLNQRVVALCTYPLDMCDSSKMLDVLIRHQFALIKHRDWTLIEPSERKRATAAVERMNQALAERTAELQAALADLRGFSRWVTHDLRAPLRSVRGFSDQLAETLVPRMRDDERHLFERIQASADRMDTLITEILAYSTAQQNALHPQLVDLAALAHETWNALTELTSAHRAQLEIRPLPPAYGDRTMLTLALANLLGNAAKFSGGAPTPYIEVGARIIDEENVYYVRDNGIGFDQDHADRIFGAFERLHDRTEYEGNGLGLTIVKQIITRHGGRVWAESAAGDGATFYFTLPTPQP